MYYTFYQLKSSHLKNKSNPRMTACRQDVMGAAILGDTGAT